MDEWLLFVQSARGNKRIGVGRAPKVHPNTDGAVAMRSLLDALRFKQNLLVELKALKEPPVLVARVLEAVTLLFGLKRGWATAKRIMADRNFLDRLQVGMATHPD